MLRAQKNLYGYCVEIYYDALSSCYDVIHFIASRLLDFLTKLFYAKTAENF